MPQKSKSGLISVLRTSAWQGKPREAGGPSQCQIQAVDLTAALHMGGDAFSSKDTSDTELLPDSEGMGQVHKVWGKYLT